MLGDGGFNARVTHFSLNGGLFAFAGFFFGKELLGFEGGDTAGACFHVSNGSK